VDPDEHLVLLRHGPLDFGDAQHLRRSVPIVDDCSHPALPLIDSAFYPAADGNKTLGEAA
jgi:hypothetical protein